MYLEQLSDPHEFFIIKRLDKSSVWFTINGDVDLSIDSPEWFNKLYNEIINGHDGKHVKEFEKILLDHKEPLTVNFMGSIGAILGHAKERGWF